MPDGRCGLPLDASGTLTLPSGEVRPGEHYFDAALRIPLQTAGYRMQRFHPFAAEGTHLYAWLDGDRYGPGGSRDYLPVELVVAFPETVARRLRREGSAEVAVLVEEAAQSFRTQSDDSYFADNRAYLERAYLAAASPEGGSGTGGDAVAWRRGREVIVDAIDRDGSFLDMGCANGLLMESVHAWAAERGLTVEPHGVDISPALVDLARRRLPQWADRLWVGNAISWTHPEGRRFDFVYALFDFVPVARRRDLVTHLLKSVAALEGRVIIGQYLGRSGGPHPSTGDILRDLGFSVAGEARPSDPDCAERVSIAWLRAASPN
jgi:SAM-dependent methyltransferase